MKKGFFRLTPIAYLLVFCFANGCATLIDFGAEDNPSEYDRGYTLDSDECKGRFCDTEADAASSGVSRRLASEMGEENDPNYQIQAAIETRDIILGMTRQDVTQSWGEPVQREVAGNGKDGHERWIYGSRYSLGGSRTVIFENGKVAGWYR